MRLGISMFAGDSGKSGISEYMKRVVSEMLDRDDGPELVLFMSHSDRAHFDPKNSRATVISYPDYVSNVLINILWHLIWLPFALKAQGCSAVFLPAANRRLGWFYGVPSVGTVHDFSQLHVPAKYDRFRLFYILKVLPFLMRRLSKVVAISESTKRDTIEFAKVNESQVCKIYNGASLRSNSGTSKASAHRLVVERLGLQPKPYLLYVSRIEHPGKNHVRFLRAYSLLKQKGVLNDYQLIFAGGAWNGSEVVEQEILLLDLASDVTLTGFVPDDLLTLLYRGADTFVFPSLFEGFGIPLLEAMASEAPVCCSNSGSMPEVVGDAAVLFDPSDINSIAQAISSILLDQTSRQNLVVAGTKRSSFFSWKKCADEVLGVFSAVLDEHGVSARKNDAPLSCEKQR